MDWYKDEQPMISVRIAIEEELDRDLSFYSSAKLSRSFRILLMEANYDRYDSSRQNKNNRN